MSAPTFCEGCGRKAADDARFCGGCGRPFEIPAGSAGAGSVAVRPASGVADVPAPGAESPERTVHEIRPVAVRNVGEFLLAVLTLGLVWLWLWIVRRNVKYRITTQRIEIVSGLVTVTRRTTDLFRVNDLEVVEPFYLRMRGAGNLVVRAQDAGESELVLAAIPGVREVHETLRTLVAAERRRMHVKVFEDGR